MKTLLIDGDLRRPNVEITLTGKETAAFGVTDFLTDNKSFEAVVQATRMPKLFYVPGGTTAPNPAELLAKSGLKGLITRALQDYERVVVDSAPIHAVSDTLLMVKDVQTVCLVIRAASTSGRMVMRCVQLLQTAAAPVSGVVLNRMPVRRRSGYGYYSGYYDYRYHGKYSRRALRDPARLLRNRASVTAGAGALGWPASRLRFLCAVDSTLQRGFPVGICGSRPPATSQRSAGRVLMSWGASPVGLPWGCQSSGAESPGYVAAPGLPVALATSAASMRSRRCGPGTSLINRIWPVCLLRRFGSGSAGSGNPAHKPSA